MPRIKGNLYNQGSLSKQAENIVKSEASGGLERLLVEGASRNYASRVNGDSHRRQRNTHKCIAEDQLAFGRELCRGCT